jgi:hypothetical protein
MVAFGKSYFYDMISDYFLLKDTLHFDKPEVKE